MPSQPGRRSRKAEWTNTPFVDEVPKLLAERGMSVRALALAAGVSQPHLSRVLRRADYKTPSLELCRAVARALDLPEDYFPEFREAAVIAATRADSSRRDRWYRQLPRPGRAT